MRLHDQTPFIGPQLLPQGETVTVNAAHTSQANKQQETVGEQQGQRAACLNLEAPAGLLLSLCISPNRLCCNAASAAAATR